MRRLIAAAALIAACIGCAAGTGAPTTAALQPQHQQQVLLHTGIRHVFLIVLENESYANSYVSNPNHYLGRRLQRQGTLLTNYYAIGHSSLDNYIAMISGQAPNPATSADCAKYANFNDTTRRATVNAAGQAVGTGCVYPRNVKTLADQLTSHRISWAGYMDDMGATRGRETRRCGVPTPTKYGFDETQIATPEDQYAARHNPFIYFHSLVDSGQCHRHVRPLTALATALAHAKTTPRFSFISPDLCNDGHDRPCKGKDVAGSSVGGLVAVDHFLKAWVPAIKASPAFGKGGLIIITSDESLGSDTSSCCNEQPGPSDPQPGKTGPGGGRTGALLIGKCIAHGTTDPRRYNHYSLLRSLEDLYGLKTGQTDGHGHLGYAAAKRLRPFGTDVFSRC